MAQDFISDFHLFITLLRNRGIEFEQRDLGNSTTRLVIKAVDRGQPTVHSCVTFKQGRLIELGTIIE